MSSSPSFVIQLLFGLERGGTNDASLFSWDTWDVDERFVRQIIEAANRRAGKIITDEDKARRQRQMKNAEKVKELAMAISKKNNSVAERCTYFPLSEIARLEDSIEQLRKVD